jgi:hypothetical protein
MGKLLVSSPKRFCKLLIYSCSIMAVQRTPELIKITSRSIDDLVTTTNTEASRRHAAVIAPLSPESSTTCCSFMNNTPTSVKNSKCPLHILPSCLLHCSKAGLFVALGIRYGLHKHREVRIDISARYVVPHALVVPFDGIVDGGASPSQSLLNKGDRWSTLALSSTLVRTPSSPQCVQIAPSCSGPWSLPSEFPHQLYHLLYHKQASSKQPCISAEGRRKVFCNNPFLGLKLSSAFSMPSTMRKNKFLLIRQRR